MPKPFKISLTERRRAIDLLIEGKSVDEACELLKARYHQDFSEEDVRRVYFPQTGTYALTRLVGASKDELEQRFLQITKREEALKKRVQKLNAELRSNDELRQAQLRGLRDFGRDPEKKALQARCAADTKRKKGYFDRQAETYRQKWQDPEYRAKMTEYFSRPDTREFRSQQIKRPESQASIAAGRKQYWQEWRRLPPEKQAPERKRRSEVARDLANCRKREEGKKRYWSAYWQQSSEKREELVSPAQREARRKNAMLAETRRKLREGYQRYVESRRRNKSTYLREHPCGWDSGERVAIVVPDYVEDVHRQEVIEGVQEALRGLSSRERLAVCELFGIAPGEEAPIAATSSDEKEDVLSAAFEKLRGNPVLLRLMEDVGV